MADQARYTYAVARGLDAASLEGLAGVGGGRLRTVTVDDLDAIVSDVPLDDFGEEGLRHHLEDLAWLEDVARAHNDVVWRVAASAPTAPMRLATIFLDDERVRERLVDLQERLVEVLDRVAGRAEWSVKVVSPPAEVEVEDADPAAPTSGTDFLRRRRAEVDQREHRRTEGVEAADQIHAELRRATVAARLLPAQDPQLSGLRGTMVLNAAYLVEERAAEDLTDLVDRLRAAHPGLEIEVAGPWPPYSFATLEEM
jgi:hypothetical protein